MKKKEESIKNLEKLETILERKILKKYLNIEENSLSRPIKEQTLRLIIERKKDKIRIDCHIIEGIKKINKNFKDVLKQFTLQTLNKKYFWKNKEREVDSFKCEINENDEIILKLELLNTSDIFQLDEILSNFLNKNNLFPSKFSSKTNVLLNIWRYSKRYDLIKNELITPNEFISPIIGTKIIKLNDLSKIIEKYLKLIKIEIKVENKIGKFIYDLPILVDNLINIPDFNQSVNLLKKEIKFQKSKLKRLLNEKEMLEEFLNRKDFLFFLLTRY